MVRILSNGNHRNNFYGETLSYGESFHTLGLSYRYKRLNIGVMTLNPFVDNYRMGGEMFSKVAPSKNWWYVKESCRLFVAKYHGISVLDVSMKPCRNV